MNLSKSNHPAILNLVNISMTTVFHRNHFYYTALTGLHVTMQSSFRFFTSRFRQFLDSDQKHSHHRYFIDPRHIRYSYEKTSYRKLYKKAFHENHSADFTELHTYMLYACRSIRERVSSVTFSFLSSNYQFSI